MSYEKNIPTEQDKEKKITRLPCKNGDEGWTQSLSPQKTKRKMAAHSVKFFFTQSMHVKKRWEFGQIRRNGQKFYGRFLCFQYAPLSAETSKLGLTVSKKHGNAPQRNLFKRKNRELFRTLRLHFPQTISINILPLIHSENASFEDFKEDWDRFLKHLNKGTDDENKAQSRTAKSM